MFNFCYFLPDAHPWADSARYMHVQTVCVTKIHNVCVCVPGSSAHTSLIIFMPCPSAAAQLFGGVHCSHLLTLEISLDIPYSVSIVLSQIKH